MLASIVGLAVGYVVALAVGGAVFGAVVGASVGIAQWLVLRRQVPRAGWWVLVSTVGGAIGFAASGAADQAVGGAVGFAAYEEAAGFDLSGVMGGGAGFAVNGAITGVVLVWLLRQTITLEPSQPEDAA